MEKSGECGKIQKSDDWEKAESVGKSDEWEKVERVWGKVMSGQTKVEYLA